jgi:hypothetical protein
VRESLERGQLRGLALGHVARGPVADEDLERGGDGGGGQGNGQRGALVAPPASVQAPDGVDGGDDEAHDQVAGQVHVGDLVPQRKELPNRAASGWTCVA